MKSFFFILSFCIIFIGCTQSSSLKIAEKIIEDHPDSAFAQLETINTSLLNERETALYKLLLTQAQYKLQKKIESDTLINQSILYFSRSNDKKKLANAYYYKGCVLIRLGNRVDAIQNLKEAEQLAKMIDDRLLSNKIYEQLFFVNFETNNYDISLKYAKLFLASSILMNDSSLVCLAYNNLSSAYERLEKNDSMLYFRTKCLELVEKDTVRAAYYYANYASNLIGKGEYDKAESWLHKAIEKKELPNQYVMLGLIAQNRGDTAETRKNWEKTLTFNDTQFNQKAYSLLSDMYKKRGDYLQAFAMKYKADSVLYAYSEQVRSTKMLEIQQKYDKSAVEKELAEKKMRWLRGIIIALVIIVVLLVAILYYVNKVKRYKGIIDRNILQINETEQKIKFLESCGEEFTEEIATLKGQMASMRETTMEKLGMGRIVYDTIAKKEPLSGFSRDKEQAFVNYFAFTYPQQYADFGQSHKNLTLRHITFLILCHHFGMFDKEIEVLLNVSSSTIRNYRLRTKKVRHHTTPGTV